MKEKEARRNIALKDLETYDSNLRDMQLSIGSIRIGLTVIKEQIEKGEI